MFEGGGFGVGLTVRQLDVEPWPAPPRPPGVVVRPTRLGEMMPVGSRTGAEVAAELQRVVQAESRLAAYKAELVSALAAQRPDGLDRRPDQPGAAVEGWTTGSGPDVLSNVSEFFPDELALVLNCSRAAATTLTETSATLLERLPATFAALADGELDWPRARAIAAELGWPVRDSDPAVVAAVEAAVLPEAPQLSVPRLRARVRAELVRRDAAAADRRREHAQRAADVTVRGVGDGMAELVALLPQPLASACLETADAYARMARADGDGRSLGRLRAGVLADLVLRPWDTSRPPVTAALTVLVPLPSLVGAGSEPAEVEGQPITGAHLRELLEQLDALCPGGLQPPAGGSLDVDLVDRPSGRLRATLTHRELVQAAGRICPRHPVAGATSRASSAPTARLSPDAALASGDPVVGVTTSPRATGCSCAVVGVPAAVQRYMPTPAQRRFVRRRDRGCRHPGCRSRVGRADLDHVRPYPVGPTGCENLCCLCRRHHRLKTHAPGWRFDLDADGVLSVTTPSGVTRTTRPPGLPEPRPRSPAPPLHADPPPF